MSLLNWLNSAGPTWLQLLIALPILVRIDWYATAWFRRMILKEQP